MAIRLPYPPSANRLWRAVNGRQIKSEAYRAWLREAATEIMVQRPARVAGSYHLTIVATRPDKRARDIDNLIKPISDALKHGGIVDDDSLAQSVLAMWSAAAPVKGGMIAVTLSTTSANVAELCAA